jgi:uncharacterized protein YceK
MIVSLRGSSPRALVAGVLLMSRARQFGQRLEVHIVGDPGDISPVRGPAVVMSPVLASCGVGRRHGGSGLILVPGPADLPLMTCLEIDGCGPWFTVDRAGRGEAPATRALLALRQDPAGERRALGDAALRALTGLGLPVEASLLDLLFGAPTSALERIALAQRAAAGLSGRSREPHALGLLHPAIDPPDPLAGPLDLAALQAAAQDGALDAVLHRLTPTARAPAKAWVQRALAAASPDPADPLVVLAVALIELLGPLAALPSGVPLPALGAGADAVARGLSAALGATGEAAPAHEGLLSTFRLFGGRFVEDARGAVDLEGQPPPVDPVARWAWFAAQAKAAATEADRLWRRVIDPES